MDPVHTDIFYQYQADCLLLLLLNAILLNFSVYTSRISLLNLCCNFNTALAFNRQSLYSSNLCFFYYTRFSSFCFFNFIVLINICCVCISFYLKSTSSVIIFPPSSSFIKPFTFLFFPIGRGLSTS